MGEAILAGRRFRIDPNYISWNYSTKAQDVPTVGGKVVQMYGTTISDMILRGQFGTGSWEQQMAFLEEMKDIGAAQAKNPKMQPHRFLYPPRDWDFLFYLKAYTDERGAKAITHSPEIFSPQWQLTLFIVEENAGIKTVAENAYIQRIARGMGWRQTEYSGGDLASLEYPQQGGSPPPDQGGGDQSWDSNQSVEQWRPLVEQYFPAHVVEEAMRVMDCESGGNPNASNTIRTQFGHAKGLFQHLEDLWPPRAEAVGMAGASYFDPRANVAASAWLYKQTNSWAAWECKP